MPLTNKFLRYSPEITLEIFTLVWNKLIQCGWGESVYAGDIEYRFMEFKGGEHLYNDENDAKSFYVNYKNIQEFMRRSGLVLTETTVQEILGYDPFVKDDFVLPDKWCIKSQSRDQDYLINKFARSCGGGHWNDENNHARNNYLNISDGEYHRGSRTLDKDFTEITFDQFKKYVLKDYIETPKEANPEYVECINVATYNTKVGEIFKCRQIDNSFEWEYNNKTIKDYSSWDGWGESWSSELSQKHFKPSTKEAFDAQNKPKQPLKQAVHCNTQEEYKFAKETLGATFNSNAYIKDESIIPLDAVGSTINLNRFGHSIYNDYQLLSFQEWCDLNGYKMETNIDLTGRYLKALVDGPQSTIFKKGDIVEILRKESKNTYSVGESLAKSWTYTTNNSTANQWELLPEDYKMEKEVKFEVGRWYKYNKWYLKYLRHDDKVFVASEYITDDKEYIKFASHFGTNDESKVLVSIEEIQQYLPDNHPNKITPVIQQSKDMQSRNNLKKGDYLYVLLPSHCGDVLEITGIQDESKYEPDSIWIFHKNRSFSGGGFRCSDKVYPFGESFRLATPEEINNHLISIGQIPAGEPLNTGIEPNKDGVFKYTTYSGTTHVGKTSTISEPLKMTLSIDDEELPMVNIIKTNTIKQLLNND